MYILSVSRSHAHTRTGWASSAAAHLVLFCLVIYFLMDVMNVCVFVCECKSEKKNKRESCKRGWPLTQATEING